MGTEVARLDERRMERAEALRRAVVRAAGAGEAREARVLDRLREAMVRPRAGQWPPEPPAAMGRAA